IRKQKAEMLVMLRREDAEGSRNTRSSQLEVLRRLRGSGGRTFPLSAFCFLLSAFCFLIYLLARVTENSPAISCKDLKKHYDDVKAVDGIDLLVERGECFGLLGPNGAGKTTTIEILEGINTPDSGDVSILGMSW